MICVVCLKFTRFSIKVCLYFCRNLNECQVLLGFHAKAASSNVWMCGWGRKCMFCAFCPHVDSCVLCICVCETLGLMALAGSDWGWWLSAAVIAAPLSVYCEPFHMSAVVKQPETEDRGAVTAWDAGREARHKGGERGGRMGQLAAEEGDRDKSSFKLWSSSVVRSFVCMFRDAVL